MTIPPTGRRRVLVDSSAYLALVDTRDEHHQDARSILSQLARARYRLYTTNAMLLESHALILSVLGNRQASQFLRETIQSSTTIIRIRARDEELARAIVFRYTDKDFSYNDAVSFVVMERLGISQAFTFDSDFAQYGFSPLTSELL